MICGANQVAVYRPYAYPSWKWYPSADRQNLVIRLPVGTATKPVVTRAWTPPWQPKVKVKFRGCQYTGCWICSMVISKPPSKLDFGFKDVIIFARQPRGSLLAATRKLPSALILGIFCVNVSILVCWLDKMCLGKKSFLLTVCWQHPDSLTAYW